MPTSFWAIELSVLAYGALLVRHASKQGARWLGTYVWAIAFGLAAELILVQSDRYSYGRFLLMVGPAGGQVPLWVGVGWGAIVYSSIWTAQRMRLPWLLRPLAAGLLAVNIDLSLDPIAVLQGFWTWKNVGAASFFGVPFDNFLAWMLIVSVYALLARVGFRVAPPGKRPLQDFLVAGVCAAVALGGLLALQRLRDPLYRALGGELMAFMVIFGAAGWVASSYLRHARRDQPFARAILGVPLYFHGLLFLILLLTQDYLRAPALVVVIPLALLVGFFATAWVSLDRVLPPAARAPDQTARAAAARRESRKSRMPAVT